MADHLPDVAGPSAPEDRASNGSAPPHAKSAAWGSATAVPAPKYLFTSPVPPARGGLDTMRSMDLRDKKKLRCIWLAPDEGNSVVARASCVSMLTLRRPCCCRRAANRTTATARQHAVRADQCTLLENLLGKTCICSLVTFLRFLWCAGVDVWPQRHGEDQARGQPLGATRTKRPLHGRHAHVRAVGKDAGTLPPCLYNSKAPVLRSLLQLRCIQKREEAPGVMRDELKWLRVDYEIRCVQLVALCMCGARKAAARGDNTAFLVRR
jgi:hypothetical protein